MALRSNAFPRRPLGVNPLFTWRFAALAMLVFVSLQLASFSDLRGSDGPLLVGWPVRWTGAGGLTTAFSPMVSGLKLLADGVVCVAVASGVFRLRRRTIAAGFLGLAFGWAFAVFPRESLGFIEE